MNKIYAVTTGSYSDYCVHALFSTREKAERYKAERAKMEWDDTNEIEEYMVDLYDGCVNRTIYSITESVGSNINLPHERLNFVEDTYQDVDHINDVEIVFCQDYKNMVYELRITAISKELADKAYYTYGPWIGTIRDKINRIEIKDDKTFYYKYQDGEYVPCNL